MITSIGLLLEELSILICIHYLYGEKFKFDIYTTSYLTIYMIIMTSINYFRLPQILTIIVYPLIFLYCGIKFGFEWKKIVINNILYLLIIGGIQLIWVICYGWIFDVLSIDMFSFRNRELLVADVGVLFIVLFVLSRLKLNKFSVYLQDKERIIVVFLIFSIFLITFSVINYKIFNGLRVYQYVILFISIFLVCILVAQLGKYKIKSKEIETELKVQKLYSDSFYNLIEEIRMRQHEFDNHISAIYSLQYTCKSYEELIKAQNEYSQLIIKDNRYNKLLKAGNPLLIGFLYGKFIEAEKLGVEITYKINIDELNIGVPIYKLVEVLGNLINNAVEAMRNMESSQALYVGVAENGENFEIEVRNKSIFIDYSNIELFFKKGFSRKGNSRGLGLHNVQTICNEYSLNILVENKILNGDNWMSFIVNNKIINE